MPRYFFHLSLEGTLLPDPDGQDLQNADEAWETAQTAAQALMQTGFERPINWFDCYFEVRNEDDEVLLEFPFSEAIQPGQQPN
jgi:hypothetical protein